MATGPKVSRNALELLTPDGNLQERFLDKIWGPLLFGTVTFGAVCFGNYASKRPPFSGIQKHIGFTALAAVLGKYADDYRNDYLAERDAVFRHYITLHPEDFPDRVSTKYSDLFLPWIPIR